MPASHGPTGYCTNGSVDNSNAYRFVIDVSAKQRKETSKDSQKQEENKGKKHPRIHRNKKSATLEVQPSIKAGDREVQFTPSVKSGLESLDLLVLDLLVQT